MEEIIKISETQIGDSSVNSVSARELHFKLNSKRDFTSWIKEQIKRGMFEYNIDFIIIWHDTKKGVVKSNEEIQQEFSNTQQAVRNGYQSDYILTLDTAKHIALMSGTAKGKEIRNYFIEVEKKYRLQLQQPKPKSRDDLISVSQSELDKELQTLDFLLNRVHFSEKEKIEFINKTLEKINFQTLENPHLLKHEPVFTLTQLLKDFRVDIRTADFNRKLESYGIIERFGNGWILLDMKFGENRHFKEGTNHRYYKSTFQELLDIVL